jgi:cytosine/adenosine deaminase-related metal-dependent hydrolase
MLKYLSADYLIPVNSAPIQNGIIVLDNNGRIVNILSGENDIPEGIHIEKHKGIIVPGFINSHCHLELSHLHGKIAKKTGLIGFLKSVARGPKYSSDVILAEINRADEAMYNAGIVAVADIANTIYSKERKLSSKIYYHTFSEVFGFEPEIAKDAFRKGVELCEGFSPLSSSITPHAPYSVSKELFRYIRVLEDKNNHLLSIHNQESEEENKFFRYKTGGFLEFYAFLNKNIDFFKAQARNSLRSILPLLPQSQRILLVHNTYTTFKDINFVERYKKDVTWCLCPNANLYIEDRLPKIDLFIKSRLPIVLGTDSLASNDKLCILSEIKTLVAHFPHLPLERGIEWATLNGAKYLGIDSQYGSLEVGKTPGLNLLTKTDGLNLTEESTLVKLI